MSNPGKADLIELVDALQEAAMAYGRHLVAEKKSIDDVKALMYEKVDYAIVSLQRQYTSTEGAPSRLRSDAGRRTDSQTAGSRQNVPFQDRLSRVRS
jgi:hypothetical protein